MTLPPLAYARPTSLDEATELLLDPAARPLAGGQSLVPALAAARGNAMAGAVAASSDMPAATTALAGDAAAPDGVAISAAAHDDAAGEAPILTLVDLSRLPDLDRITSASAGGLRIGALVTQRAAERSALVAERAPLLVEALGEVGHPSTRNRGTVVGSLAHADPAAEVPAVAVALGASVVIAGAGGVRREVSAERLLACAPRDALVEQHPRDARRAATAGLPQRLPLEPGEPIADLQPQRLPLEPGELIVELLLPAPVAGERHAWLEFAPRRFDLPLVGAAVRLAPDGRARLTLAGVAAAPMTADLGVHTTSRSAVIGLEETIARLDPPTDARASGALRRHLARTLALRALEAARG